MRKGAAGYQVNGAFILGCLASILGAADDGSPTSGQPRLFIERAAEEPGRFAAVNVQFAPIHDLPGQVEFQCQVHSSDSFNDVDLRMKILNAAGNPVHEGAASGSLAKGANPFRFDWEPTGLADGAYSGVLEVLSGNTTLARSTLSIRQISRAGLDAKLRDTMAAASGLGAHFARLHEQGIRTGLPEIEFAIAQDYLPAVRGAMDAGDWRRAEDVVDYAHRTIATAAARLALSGLGGPEPAQGVPVNAIGLRRGSFWSGERPVFLFGVAGDPSVADHLPVLSRYGLNLAVASVGPSDTLRSSDAKAAPAIALKELLAAADAANVSVAIQLAPNALPAWAMQTHPELRAHQSAGFAYDVTHPDVRPLLGRHLSAVASAVEGQARVNSIILADRPRFRMNPDAIREGLVALARAEYGSYDWMNRAWRTRHFGFHEVVVDWDRMQPAYRYDLMSYHQGLGAEFLSWLAVETRKRAPGVPLQVALDAGVFDPGSVADGINWESVAPLFEISGCAPPQDFEHSYLALGYPNQTMQYTLLRSLNPDAPVFNAADDFLNGPARTGAGSFRHVYTLMWEGAIAGRSASAVPLQDAGTANGAAAGDLLDYPASLAGYAAACSDLNRLAPIVAAFQQAPAEVYILWSMASAILSNGLPYLESLKFAYEGCDTFGYHVRFITENQCARSGLDHVKVLVLPQALAVPDEAFNAINHYIESGSITIRSATPIPYNEWGQPRNDSLSTSVHTILIRSGESPTSYLHALDAAYALGGLPETPRPINEFGYPLEGVKSRFVLHDGAAYLYLVNLRKDSVSVSLFGRYRAGLDLIGGGWREFPAQVAPLEPMLLRLEPPDQVVQVAQAESATPPGGVPAVPSATVRPLPEETQPRRGGAPRPQMRHGRG